MRDLIVPTTTKHARFRPYHVRKILFPSGGSIELWKGAGYA